MAQKILGIFTGVCIVSLAWLLQATNPTSAGPVGILLVFILIYLSLLGLVTFLLFYLMRGLSFILKSFNYKKQPLKLSFEKAYYYSTVLALLPMILVGIYASGGVSFYEALLVLFFGFVGILYIAKR